MQDVNSYILHLYFKMVDCWGDAEGTLSEP
jgi:hypothetical protein